MHGQTPHDPIDVDKYKKTLFGDHCGVVAIGHGSVVLFIPVINENPPYPSVVIFQLSELSCQT